MGMKNDKMGMKIKRNEIVDGYVYETSRTWKVIEMK